MKAEPDLLNQVTIPELESVASTVGYPKDIVRDTVVTIHGPAKGTAWFPSVHHQGNIDMENIVTDLALRIGNIVTDLTLRIGNIVTDLALRIGNIVTDLGLRTENILTKTLLWTHLTYICLVVKQCKDQRQNRDKRQQGKISIT